jgi:ASC-1-like (ASCH) protein
MSESPEQQPGTNEPQGQVISLENISRKYLSVLQRRHDILAYEVASIPGVDAEKYEYFARLARLMPVNQIHMDHAQVQRQIRGKITVQVLNDLLGMAAGCMDECHFLLTLIANKPEVEAGAAEANRKVAEAQEAFSQSALQDKFDTLEKNYGIMCELEDGIISLAFGLRVMMGRGGVVEAEDLGDDGELAFEFKSVQQINPPVGAPEGTKPELRLADTRRAFRAGDTIEFTNSEIMGLTVTIASFFHGLFRSVDDFGRRKLGAAAQQSPASHN